MLVPRVVLLVSVGLGVAACATTSRATPVPGIVVEVVNAPTDLGPLTIWVSPIYQDRRTRLGDVLPGGGGSFTYDAPGVGRHLMTAEPQLQARTGLTITLDVLSDTEHVVWDLRSNKIRGRER